MTYRHYKFLGSFLGCYVAAGGGEKGGKPVVASGKKCVKEDQRNLKSFSLWMILCFSRIQGRFLAPKVAASLAGRCDDGLRTCAREATPKEECLRPPPTKLRTVG